MIVRMYVRQLFVNAQQFFMYCANVQKMCVCAFVRLCGIRMTHTENILYAFYAVHVPETTICALD